MTSRLPERCSTALVVVALACASCAVGPDFQRPAPPESPGYAFLPAPAATASAVVAQGESQRVVLGERIRADWWRLFGSPELDALVARALAANPTIEAAQASLRIARENAAAQRGFFFPTVAAGYNVNRTKQSGAVPAATTATPAVVGPSPSTPSTPRS